MKPLCFGSKFYKIFKKYVEKIDNGFQIENNSSKSNIPYALRDMHTFVRNCFAQHILKNIRIKELNKYLEVDTKNMINKGIYFKSLNLDSWRTVTLSFILSLIISSFILLIIIFFENFYKNKKVLS